jgi:GT2 family glycosyltransferase
MIKISVVIPTFNRKDYLKKLLTLLESQKLDSRITLTIIVVNDGSSDGTLEMLSEEFPQVISVLGDGNWWWTKCINEGIKVALNKNTDFVLLFNDDTEIKNNYINNLYDDYQTLTPGSILCSASVSLQEKDKIDSAGIKYFSKLFGTYSRYYERNSRIDENFKGIHECYSASGRGTLIPREIFKRLGLLDEKMIQYGSDEDYILCAKEKGVPVYITWNNYVLNHTKLTGAGKFPQDMSFLDYLSTFFNKYTNKSLSLNFYFYKKHCLPYLAPLCLLYFFSSEIAIFFLRKKENLFNKK